LTSKEHKLESLPKGKKADLQRELNPYKSPRKGYFLENNLTASERRTIKPKAA
jgi:hypothetical protein